MYEKQTFDNIISRMLNNVGENIDKREGSVIYTALAPIAQELATYYEALDEVLSETFADTADYYYLCKRAAERNLYPVEATASILRIVAEPTTADINVGDKFTSEDYELSFEVISGDDVEGAYNVVCVTEGTVGNITSGTLIPIEEINGLENVKIQGAVAYDDDGNKILDSDGNETYKSPIIQAGTDEEDVETFRARYFASLNTKAFGGNKEDYLNKIKENTNVGACKVIRAWKSYSPIDLIPDSDTDTWFESYAQNDIESHNLNSAQSVWKWLQSVYTAAKNKLLVTGGTVNVYILDGKYNAPSNALMREVQSTLDPTNGNGDGVVPIGHVVNVTGAVLSEVGVDMILTLKDEYTLADIKDKIKTTLVDFMREKRSEWEANDNIQIVSIDVLTSVYSNISSYLTSMSQCNIFSEKSQETISLTYELGGINHTAGNYFDEISNDNVRTPASSVINLSQYDNIEIILDSETADKYRVILWLCDATGYYARNNGNGTHKIELSRGVTSARFTVDFSLYDYMRIEVKERFSKTFVQSEAETVITSIVGKKSNTTITLDEEAVPTLGTVIVNGEVI